MLIVERLHPRQRFVVPCADLLAIHNCLGPVPAGRQRKRVNVTIGGGA
jgi:hypothetical protein